ncbi:MAG: uncharacterized protein A8A55_3640, partial [Amphiamblys sp. WSBS2006]
TDYRENIFSSIWLGKVKSLKLYGYAINLLPKLKLHEDNVLGGLWLDNVLGGLWLDKEFGECVSSILRAKDNSIWPWKVKSLKLEHHAINLLPKLWLHEDNVMEKFELDAEIGEYVFSIIS